MSAESVKTHRLQQPENIERVAAVREAVLFLLPSLIITASTILLFGFLTGFTMEQQNRFVVVIFLAIIPSLLGIAGFQVLVYRIIEENAAARGNAPGLVLFFGLGFAILFSVVVAGLILAFHGSLGLTLADFFYFAALLLMFSMTWAIMAVFWATRQFYYPAFVFGAGYLLVLAITYGFHRIGPEYTIAGYTLGIFLVLAMMAAASLKAFGRFWPDKEALSTLSLPSVACRNYSLIVFSWMYVLALFLDKIIVWVYQGIQSGTGLFVPGPYTAGAFLGLVPLFSLAASLYFGRTTREVVEKRYEGTLADIRNRAGEYLKMYRQTLGFVLALWAILFLLVVGPVYFWLPDPAVLRTTITIGVGSLFLVLILHNSQFLVTFGKVRITALAVAIVVVGELASIPFVPLNEWFAAAGFAAGALLGFVLSETYTWMISWNFEFHVYRYAARCAGLNWD
jgi:hypothetical protein